MSFLKFFQVEFFISISIQNLFFFNQCSVRKFIPKTKLFEFSSMFLFRQKFSIKFVNKLIKIRYVIQEDFISNKENDKFNMFSLLFKKVHQIRKKKFSFRFIIY